jgi:hypothetical protein
MGVPALHRQRSTPLWIAVQASADMVSLYSLVPSSARLVVSTSGDTRTVPSEAITDGDVIRVLPGVHSSEAVCIARRWLPPCRSWWQAAHSGCPLLRAASTYLHRLRTRARLQAAARPWIDGTLFSGRTSLC